jgi:hypothetical protein
MRFPFWLILVSSCIVVAGVLGAGWYYGRSTPDNSLPGAISSAGSQANDDTKPTLDQPQREYLWEVEHHALLLSKYWFRDLAEALMRGDAAALKAVLAGDFSAQVMARGSEEHVKQDFVQVIRRKEQGTPPSPFSGDAFVAWLMEFRKEFSKPPAVRLYPRHLAPCVRQNLDGPWNGSGVLRMWGEAGAAEPLELVLHLTFQLPRPAQNHESGWLRSCTITQLQKSHAASFFFRDVTRERGIDPDQLHNNWNSDVKPGNTGGIYLCDFNRDGILDLLVVDVRRLALYQGLPAGKFLDVTDAVGLPQEPPPVAEFSLAVVADLDGDGWEDLILAGRVFRNVLGRRFEDVTHRTNLRLPRSSSGVALADFDRDGKVDLYVVQTAPGKADSWLDGRTAAHPGNQLWRNLGNWQFEEVGAASNTLGGGRSVFSAVWLDANDDGWPDLFIPNEFGNGALLVNKRDGTFAEHPIMKGPNDFGTMGLTCGDVNNDGKIDLYLANMYSKTGARIIANLRPNAYPEEIMATMRRFVAGSQLYLNRGDLRFEPVGQAYQMNDVGWAYGPALADLDNDGWLDLFATSGFITADPNEPDG